VLGIAFLIYLVSWQIGGIRSREILAISGFVRMLGFAGMILGIVDLFRKRKPKKVPEQETSQSDEGGPNELRLDENRGER
jgi:hypothetical protein